MKNIKISIGIIFLVFSCSPMYRKPLHFQRVDYHGNDFRMDGFYYSKRYCKFHFYRNGVMYGGFFSKNFDGIIKSWNYLIQNPKSSNYLPWGWGVFLVNYPEIKLEHWHSGDAGARYPTAQYSGRILNDTTLLLTGGPFGTDTFHFHAMPTKPDSTNRFIK